MLICDRGNAATKYLYNFNIIYSSNVIPLEFRIMVAKNKRTKKVFGIRNCS